MDIIRELWYGNVSPFEQCTRGDKQMKDIQMWLGHSDIGTTVNVRNPHTNKMQVKAA